MRIYIIQYNDNIKEALAHPCDLVMRKFANNPLIYKLFRI